MNAKELKEIMSNYWDMNHPEVDDFVNEVLAKSKEEAEERYEKVKKSIITLELIEELPRGSWLQVERIVKAAFGKSDKE